MKRPAASAPFSLTASCHCGAVRILRKWGQNTVAVNASNFELDVLRTIRVRHLDGAATWKYLD